MQSASDWLSWQFQSNLMKALVGVADTIMMVAMTNSEVAMVLWRNEFIKWHQVTASSDSATPG
jgi:hypothetical protein